MAWVRDVTGMRAGRYLAAVTVRAAGPGCLRAARWASASIRAAMAGSPRSLSGQRSRSGPILPTVAPTQTGRAGCHETIYQAVSRSFLLGPDGPARAPPGHRCAPALP